LDLPSGTEGAEVPVVAVARVEELGAGQGQAVAQVVVAWPVAAARVQALLEVGLVPVV